MQRFFEIITILLCTAACTSERDSLQQPYERLSATIAPDVRTALGSDTCSVVWLAGDTLRVWSATTAATPYVLDSAYAGAASGTFQGIHVGGSPRYALYPYTCVTSTSDQTATLALPSTQAYRAGSFASGSNPMAAVSDSDTFVFRNLCGVLALQLTGSVTVASITLTATEQLAGTCSVTLAAGEVPQLSLTQPTATSLKMTGMSVPLSASVPQTFYFVVPPQTYASGMQFTLTDTVADTLRLVTKTPVTVARSGLVRLSAVAFDVPVEYETDASGVWTPWRDTTCPAFTTSLAVRSIGAGTLSTARLTAIADYLSANTDTSWLVDIDLGAANYTSTTFPMMFSDINHPSHMRSLVLPANITVLGYAALYGCVELQSVTLPDGLQQIATSALNGCRSLTAITLPAGVQSVDEYAFFLCSKLQTLTCLGATAPVAADTAFGTASSTATQIGSEVTEGKTLVVPTTATGYTTGGWAVLTSTMGYTLSH